MKRGSNESSDDIQDEHWKVIKITVASIEVDSLLKSALGVSKNKIDIVFHENNCATLFKNNMNGNEGDEVDLKKFKFILERLE